MQKQFPLDSLIDNGTVDIIQSDPQWKKKNSLIYKGILSNMTKRAGNGILTTTGRNLKIRNNSLIVDWDEIHEYDDSDFIAGDYTSRNTSKILAYRRVWADESHGGGEDGAFVDILVRKSGNKIIIESESEVYWEYDDLYGEQLAEKAYIFDNGTVAFTGDSDDKIIFYNIFSDSDTTKYFTDQDGNGIIDSNTELFGSTRFGIILGLDNKDLRKRKTIRFTKDSDDLPSSVYHEIYGFGCVHDKTAMVTGEPIPVFRSQSVQSIATTERRIQIAQGQGGVFDWKEGLDNFAIGYTHEENNGVFWRAPFNPNASSFTRRKWDDSASLNGSKSYSTVSEGNYVSVIAKQGAQTEEGTQESANRPDWYNSSPTFDTVGNTSLYSSNLDLGIIYIYSFSWRSSFGYLYAEALDATKRWQGQATNTGKSFAGSAVSFIDFDNPVGKIGWNENASSSENIGGLEQIYPHLKHFFNDTTRKGSYWDYGPGWVKFFWDRIYAREYTRAGFTIFESPLQLVEARMTPDSDYPKTTYRDFDFAPIYQNCHYTNNYHDDWPYYASSYLGTSETVRSLNPQECIYFGQNLDYYIHGPMRPHPRLASYQNSTWSFNHSLTGTDDNSSLNSCPTRYNIIDDLDLIVYEGLPIAISFRDTLINTPHDIRWNWNVSYGGGGYAISFWSDDNYESIIIGKLSSEKINFRLEVRKIEDYTFVTNVLGKNNVLVENRNGDITLQQGFLSFAMDSYIEGSQLQETLLKLPPDSTTSLSNDVLYYGSGINSLIKEQYPSTSFLLPAITISAYVDPDDTSKFNTAAIASRRFPIVANIEIDDHVNIPTNTKVQEYFTHSQLTTDVSYKDSFFTDEDMEMKKTYEDEYRDTTWLPGSELIIYPIGVMSKTYGENYITATVEAGDGYVARFYNKDNKTFLVFNQSDLVYYGSEIFTIMSGNYYFDGQGIYYLGSQTDYSQNIFTAYAVGMQFLANSSAEAYFYAPWDKSIYIYTASNTLQRGFSLADRGNILDALYSPAEQAFYILFDDNCLYIKTQNDDCLIENVQGTQLQSTNLGAFVITDNGFEIYNPYRWSEKLPLNVETEWLEDTVAIQKTSFVDFVFYRDDPKAIEVTMTVAMLHNGEVIEETQTHTIKREDWKNQLARVRFVPNKSNLVGNAVKVKVKGDDVSLFNINLEMTTVADVPTATRGNRV